MQTLTQPAFTRHWIWMSPWKQDTSVLFRNVHAVKTYFQRCLHFATNCQLSSHPIYDTGFTALRRMWIATFQSRPSFHWTNPRTDNNSVQAASQRLKEVNRREQWEPVDGAFVALHFSRKQWGSFIHIIVRNIIVNDVVVAVVVIYPSLFSVSGWKRRDILYLPCCKNITCIN